MNLTINDEYFGELLPYVKDPNITDITWNGKALWTDNLITGRKKEDIVLQSDFIERFASRIADLANKNFNASQPLLEAETEDLRISIVDNSVTSTGKSIAIRKTPAVRRLNEETMVQEKYASELVLFLLKAFVRSHCSIIVTGDVGAGKTELVKFLTKFIPSYERTISIEDNFELRLSKINPDLDCVEVKVTPQFDYTEAIKSALRQLCKWLLMSEARSREVVQLLEAASTGCCVITTIHSDDVRKLPDRIVNMMGTAGEEKRNDVFNFFDVAIKIDVRKTQQGVSRRISQIGIFDRDQGENYFMVIYENGRFITTELPDNILGKMHYANVRNPLSKEELGKYMEKRNEG